MKLLYVVPFVALFSVVGCGRTHTPPPVAQKIEHKIDVVKEKIEEKVERVEEKVDELKAQVEEKVEAVKEHVEEKVEAIKEHVEEKIEARREFHIEEYLDQLESFHWYETNEHLDWRSSVVDLCKTVNFDSSFSARRSYAEAFELDHRYRGTGRDNVWLHGHLIRFLEGR